MIFQVLLDSIVVEQRVVDVDQENDRMRGRHSELRTLEALGDPAITGSQRVPAPREFTSTKGSSTPSEVRLRTKMPLNCRCASRYYGASFNLTCQGPIRFQRQAGDIVC